MKPYLLFFRLKASKFYERVNCRVLILKAIETPTPLPSHPTPPPGEKEKTDTLRKGRGSHSKNRKDKFWYSNMTHSMSCFFDQVFQR